MGGAIKADNSNQSIYVTNYGTINLCETNGGNGCTKKAHFKNVNLVLQDYAMRINVDSATFNAFDGNAMDNSHLVLDSVTSVSFADKNSKLILEFGEKFEFGAGYKLDKLIVKADKGENALGVDISRLTTRNDIYFITQSGQYFIAKLAPEYSTIGNLYKSNIHTMNNFYTISNAMIYPRKSQNLGKKNQLQVDSVLDSANPLKSYESFSYRSEAQTRRIQRQNKRNYNRKTNNAESSTKSQGRLPRATNRTRNDNFNNSANGSQNQRPSQNLNDYYFILTPFVNYNSFNKAGNYTLSGFDYGFLTAFSGKLTPSNTLGTHFIMSYGTLGDSKDKDFSITNLNLNVGLNYKFDMIWDMYLKARGDFFYFLNQVKTLTMPNAIKPNNLGFGLSVSYGKDFDFKEGGVLGLEVGLDYKGLNANEITLKNNADSTINERYKKALYHLLYADLGLNYNKYFGSFGINATLGIRGNITANKLATSKIHISTFNKSVDMVLDNDNFLGYANLGVSYVLNHKNFDMEFSLAYYGNFGDRVISNGGGVEIRVVF